MFTTLISASELQQLGNRHTVLLDCRFRLNDPDFGLINLADFDYENWEGRGKR